MSYSSSDSSFCTARKLTAEDEEEFIKLLCKVYGRSYSYTLLYEKGGFASLINSKKLTSYGEFDEHGQLLSHTAFWHKEPNGDYVESGCSFRVSGGIKKFKSAIIPKVWQDILKSFAAQYQFIHQHNSTLHVLAQRYASRMMNAKYCGLIFGYAENEEVKGIEGSTDQMHALIMSTVLHPQKEKKIFIPKFCQSWLMNIYKNLGIPRTFHPVDLSTNMKWSFSFREIETNPYISLQRRLIQKSTQMDSENIKGSWRTDLVHLPLEEPELVENALPLLFQSGYIPCGLRPHSQQSDELILQNFTENKFTIEHLIEEMKISNSETLREIEKWQKLVLQIM